MEFCLQGAAAGVPAEQDGAAAGGAEAETSQRGLLEGQGDSGALLWGFHFTKNTESRE